MAEAETKSVADVLREARKLIEKPEAWTQGAYFRTADGAPVGWCAANDLGSAVCLCSIGAVAVAVGTDPDRFWPMGSPEQRALSLLTDAADGDLPSFNDTHTHAEVLAAFDAAIALAEEAQ